MAYAILASAGLIAFAALYLIKQGRRYRRRTFRSWRLRIIERLQDVEEQVQGLNRVIYRSAGTYNDLPGEGGNNEAVAVINSIEVDDDIKTDHIECNRCHIKFDVDQIFNVYYCPGCGSKFTDYKDGDAAANSGSFHERYKQ